MTAPKVVSLPQLKVITLKKAPEAGSTKTGSGVTPKPLVTLLKPQLRTIDMEQKRITLQERLDQLNAQLKTKKNVNQHSTKITLISRPTTNIRIIGKHNYC